MTTIWLLAFSILIFVFSILYFYMFSRKQEQFMQFWGFSWVAYSCSLLCLFIYLVYSKELFLELRKIIDMINILLLLLGAYSFMHVKAPVYWYKFSLYLLLLAGMCMMYGTELLSFYLPISIYQLVITAFLCYNVFKKWDIPRGERIISTASFLFWGAGKAIFSIVEIFNATAFNYMLEIILSNIVNFCILTIYVVYTRKENDLTNNIYKTIVENTSDAIFYYKLNPEHAFEYISPSIENLTGYSPSFFYNDPNHLMALSLNPNINILESLISGAKSREPYVVELARKDGEVFWAEFTSKVIENDSKEPIALEGTLRDVTKFETAEVEHINAINNRNKLLSYISHELRTPITSIAGYLTAISDGTLSSNEDRKEALEIITGKTMTLKRLIDDMDQLSKLENHQFTFEYITCTAGEIAEMLIADNIEHIDDNEFKITLDYNLKELNKWWIIVDRSRINQVFSNLITNALKYSLVKKELHVEFKTDDASEHFIVSVHDCGIGIKDENIPKVFDKFYRDNDKSLKIEGRGLGLTICKEIIAAHRGDIYAESTYGQGSTFTFIIPLYMEV
ncbi:MAG: PAS domain S-box protein [Clostridiales bacterium]|nr:PAS domain S-box protein [Clostridiales bacterium]